MNKTAYYQAPTRLSGSFVEEIKQASRQNSTTRKYNRLLPIGLLMLFSIILYLSSNKAKLPAVSVATVTTQEKTIPPATPITPAESTPTLTTLPVAPAVPVLKKQELTSADRKHWYTALRWPQECEQKFDYDTAREAGLRFFELDHDRFLVEVTCKRDSPQGSQVYLSLDESKFPPNANVLSFKTYISEDGTTLQGQQMLELTGQGQFDKSKKTLTVLHTLGTAQNCGVVSTYGIARRPVIKELKAKLSCDTKSVSPQNWPKIPLP